MTRAQFVAECNDINDLVSFCFDNNLDQIIYDNLIEGGESLYEHVKYKLTSGEWCTIEQMTDFLDGRDGSADWYKYDETYDCIEEIDEDDINELKEEILQYHDDVFEDEEDDEFFEDDYSDEADDGDMKAMFMYEQLSSVI